MSSVGISQQSQLPQQQQQQKEKENNLLIIVLKYLGEDKIKLTLSVSEKKTLN